MVSCDDEDAARLVYCLLDARDAKVNCFDADLDCLENASVPDHVSIGEVASDEVIFSRENAVKHHIRSFGALHPRALLEGHHVRWHLDVFLQLVIDFA